MFTEFGDSEGFGRWRERELSNTRRASRDLPRVFTVVILTGGRRRLTIAAVPCFFCRLFWYCRVRVHTPFNASSRIAHVSMRGLRVIRESYIIIIPVATLKIFNRVPTTRKFISTCVFLRSNCLRECQYVCHKNCPECDGGAAGSQDAGAGSQDRGRRTLGYGQRHVIYFEIC